MTCLYIILILQHYLLIRFNSEYSKFFQEKGTRNFKIGFISIPIAEYDLLIILLIIASSLSGNPFGFIFNLIVILCLLGAFLCFVVMQCLVFYSYNRKI